MDKQEQINEMIEAFKDAIGNNALIDMDAEECALDCNGVDHVAEQCAESLYNLGYRKQSDTAREILKPLYDCIMEHSECCVNLSEDIKFNMKKYGVEVKE